MKMKDVWTMRLRRMGVGLGVATFAALGLAGVLRAAGDAVGAQASAGFAAVIGLAFVADLIALAICPPVLEKASPDLGRDA
jgi:hypothetical protein